ncbi:MAG TPA: hypothetical protein VI338_06195 [Nitrososphaera sp.]|nr:hypothetical protein [Nitrososphaera sp.]
MYDPEDQELQAMSSRIINAVKKYSIPYERLTGPTDLGGAAKERLPVSRKW